MSKVYGNSYYGAREAQDAMAVIAKWISGDHTMQTIFHDGDAVDADIFKRIIRIPKLACSNGLTDEALMLLRGRVYHEAGHIGESNLTKAEYPKQPLHQIWNAVEDCRMEKVIADKYAGAGPVFHAKMEYYNRKIANDASEVALGTK